MSNNNTNNNLTFTPFNTTPGTNKLLFEGTGDSATNESGNLNNENSLHYGSRTPFQLIPMDFESLKKYNFNESAKVNTIFNSGGDNLNYSPFDTNTLNAVSNKLKMPQVERRAKRHFHESFMDSFDDNLMSDYNDSGKPQQNTLQQPIPTSMLLNKVGKQKSGLTRSTGHLNLSLYDKFKANKRPDELPAVSQQELNNKHKTLNDKIAAWSAFSKSTDDSAKENDLKEQESDLKNKERDLKEHESDLKNKDRDLKENVGSVELSSRLKENTGGLNLMNDANESNNLPTQTLNRGSNINDYIEQSSFRERKNPGLSISLPLNEKPFKESLYSHQLLNSTSSENSLLHGRRESQLYGDLKQNATPIHTASNLWTSSTDSTFSIKPWNTGVTSPGVASYTDMYNNAALLQSNYDGSKMRKTSNTDTVKQGLSNPSFIDAKPDPEIFNSSKLVSKFSLDASNMSLNNTSSGYSNNNIPESSYSESLTSENSSNSRSKKAFPDTPVKKPINMQHNVSFLQNKPTIFEEDENMDYTEESGDSTKYSQNVDSLKLSFQHLENKNTRVNTTDVYKRSPTNTNHSNRLSRGANMLQRGNKVFHKQNNSVTTITTINSNISNGASIDTQSSLNRHSVVIGSDLNVSLQKLTDDLYGDDDIMDIEETLNKATPTKNAHKGTPIEKASATFKNQFSTPQKQEINNHRPGETRMKSLNNTKPLQNSLKMPINLEYRSYTPGSEFISPDSKQATSILIKNNEDDIHYSYLITKFSKVEELTNAGSFARVFKVAKNLSNSKSLEKKAKTCDIFAVKCMSAHNARGTYVNVLNEIHILQTISKYREVYRNKLYAYKKKARNSNNETVVRYNSRSEGEENDFSDSIDESAYVFDFITSWKHENGYYIISDYYENGTLNDFIQKQIVNVKFKFDDFRIWKIIVEVCHGLNFIHRHCKVVHLDLKPSNIFVTFEGGLKIGDFGLSTKLPLKGKYFENEGDREYIAPEIIRESVYDFKADIFSLGLMIVELACNVVLPDNGQVWQRLRSGNISDIGRISSSEINRLLNDTGDKSSSDLNNSRLTPLSSASNFIGTSKLNEIERNTGKSIPAWVPKFLIDGMSLDRIVTWMINPDYQKRPSAMEILLTEECEYVGMTKKSGATIFEGDFGPKLERF